MTVYLAKFELNKKASYKFGHTKYYYANKRFQDQDYKKFDKITILDEIRISEESAQVAREKAKLIEACLLAFFPKNFLLEEFYNTDLGYFNNLSGITEMFVLQEACTEKDVLNVFKAIKTKITQILG